MEYLYYLAPVIASIDLFDLVYHYAIKKRTVYGPVLREGFNNKRK